MAKEIYKAPEKPTLKQVSQEAFEATSTLQDGVAYMHTWAGKNQIEFERLLAVEGLDILFGTLQHHTRMQHDSKLKRLNRGKWDAEGKAGPISKPKISEKAKDKALALIYETESLLFMSINGKSMGNCKRDEVSSFGDHLFKSGNGMYVKAFFCKLVAADMKNGRKLISKEFAGAKGDKRLVALFNEAEKRAALVDKNARVFELPIGVAGS